MKKKCIGRTEFIIIQQYTQPRHKSTLSVNICTQPTSITVILFAAKFEKIFQDAIMAEQVPCFQLGFDFLNVENSDNFEESSLEVANRN